jgi:ABC-type glycerol-3-phosphate transport system substrate-binding protein
MYSRVFEASVQRKSAALFTMAVLLAGCHAVLPEPELPPHRGVNLRLACPPGLGQLVQTQSRIWQSRQQATVRAEEYDPVKGPSAVADADVWLVPPADLPRWAAAGQVVALPRSFTAPRQPFEWRTLLPAYREQLLTWNGSAWAVPLVGEAPVCVYRADVYDRPAVAEQYRQFQQDVKKAATVLPLRAPATWQEFAVQAEFFSRHHPSGKSGPSLPPLPADEAALDRLFYTVAAPHARRAVPQDEPRGPDHVALVFAFHYDLQTGKPRIAGPGFVAALDLLQRLQSCRPEGPSARPAEAFLTGQAILGVVEASWLVEFQKKPALRDRFGVCQVPGADHYFTLGDERVVLKDRSNRVPYLGGRGWLACVPSTSRQQEAALDLLADLAGPDRCAQAALEPGQGGPVRTTGLLRESWSAYDLDGPRSAALREAMNRTLLGHGIKNPVVCLRTPDQAAHRAALVAEVRQALLERKPAQQALAGAARKWEELDAKKGKKAHLAEYRLSLGLLGK